MGDPVRGWDPAASAAPWAAGVTFEAVSKPMISRVCEPEVSDAGDESCEDVDDQLGLGTAVAAHLQGRYALGDRVAIALDVPVWGWAGAVGAANTAGPGFGDIALWAPVSLLSPEAGGSGLALGLLPGVSIPTGAQRRLVGDEGFGGQLSLGVGWSGGPLAVSAHAGGRYRGVSDTVALDRLMVHGGLGPVFGGSVRLRLGDSLSLQGLVDGGSSLWVLSPETCPDGLGGAGNPPGSSCDTLSAVGQRVLPVEAGFAARGLVGESGFGWSLGVHRGVKAGIGASAARVLAGVSYSPPVAPVEPGPDPDPQPEPILADLVIQAIDPEGRPVPFARLMKGEEVVGTTDITGRYTAPAGTAEGLRLEAELFLPSEALAPQGAEETERVVPLAWAPTPVRILVTDEKGMPLAAKVSVDGLEGGPFVANAQGVVEFQVNPGTWRALIEAAGMGSQARTFRVIGGRAIAQDADVILLPAVAGPDARLVLQVTDEEQVGLDDVVVRIDGRPVGSTGSGGVIEVQQLAPGPHRVDVRHDQYQALEIGDIAFKEGENPLQVPLKRVPGSVRVIARGPDGRVPDASVRFLGPTRLPPADLGSIGERIFVVRPGEWEVLVTSEAYGLQSRKVIVPPDRTELLTVEVVLAGEGGPGDLVLKIVDPDGNPVNAAKVELDGANLGFTSTGGSIEVRGLNVGARTLSLSAERFVPQAAAEIFLVEGSQERVVVMDWQPGTVQVTAGVKGGFVRDGTSRFAGPAPVPALDLGPFGEGFTQLPAGPWQVLVTSPKHGMAAQSLEVPPEWPRLVKVQVNLGADAAGTADLRLRVVDPEGHPTDGLAVSLEGKPVGVTSAGGRLGLDDLGAGDRTLEVRGTPFKPATSKVSLAEGATEYEIQLAWAPGAVKVVTRDAKGQPVTDAMIRVSGGAPIPTARVDERGVRLVQLPAGDWQMLVASPSFGFIDRKVTIRPDQETLEVVEFTLVEVPAGFGQLLARVEGPDGKAVSGATVSYGGKGFGQTEGGALVLNDLTPGKAPLLVQAPGFQPLRVEALQVAEGSQERVFKLDWVPVPVVVQVVDSAGAPVDAEVRFFGASERAPVPAPKGEARFTLPPGTWQVLAAAPELGIKAENLVVPPGASEQTLKIQLDKAKVKLTLAQVVIEDKIPFDLDKDTIKPEARPLLKEIAATLIANPHVLKVQIEGHTDTTGSLNYNLELSERRAQAVMRALVELGVAQERLVARGYGATQPIASNDDEAGRSANRRVEFEILEQATEK